METLEAIRNVRAVRSYRPEPLPGEVLTAIVDAARHAGSSKNLQRWDFVLVRDPGALARLAEVGPYAGHVPGATAVLALMIPAPRPDDPHSVVWDLGRAAQNAILAAWSLGVGTCPVTVYEQGVVSEVLGLPDDRHCPYIISMGWPADPTDLTRPPRAGGRRPLEEVFHDGRW